MVLVELADLRDLPFEPRLQTVCSDWMQEEVVVQRDEPGREVRVEKDEVRIPTFCRREVLDLPHRLVGQRVGSHRVPGEAHLVELAVVERHPQTEAEKRMSDDRRRPGGARSEQAQAKPEHEVR